jgi:transposase
VDVREAAVVAGAGVHVAFATQAQEAFLEGHVLAFEYFGAVPGRIRYDNLKPAVIRVLRGGDRWEAERFIALRSHYGFDLDQPDERELALNLV